MNEFIILLVLLLAVLSICVPAKIEIKNELLYFRVWPYFSHKPKPLSEIKSYKIEIGFFPVKIYFKDGTVFKWTSYPLWKHRWLREQLNAVTEQQVSSNA